MSPRFKRPTIPNPVTQRQFRRSVWLEVYLPVIVGLVAAIGVMVLVVASATQGGQVSSWADASLILLILPGLVIGTLLFVLFGGLAFGVWWLVKEAPPYLRLAQDYAALFSREARKVSNKIVTPILRVESILAAVRSFLGR